jgi:hypothetical protein
MIFLNVLTNIQKNLAKNQSILWNAKSNNEQ